MLRQSCVAFSVRNRSKWFCSRLSEFLPITARGMKMRADINWIIPDIMTSTNDLRKETLVSHISPHLFDEKDGQRQCYLEIESRRSSLIDNLTLYVWLKQPNKSSITTKLAVVVRDEKEGQPRQLIYESTTRSTKIFGPNGNIAESFKIGGLEEFKKLSTVSVTCTVEYDQDDLKESNCPSTESHIIGVDQHSTVDSHKKNDLNENSNPNKQTESSIIDVDRNPMKLPVPSIANNNRYFGDCEKKVLKESDAPINQVASPIIDVGKGKEIRYNQEASTIIDVNQHSTGLIQQDLEQLLKNQSATDICFIIGSQRLRAHKLMLSARSPVFSAIIKTAEANDNLEDGVEIKNMSFITFMDLIHFIYTDQVFLTESNAEKLLAAAKEYAISLLINKCEYFLYSTSLTVENCCEKLITADVNNAVHLKKMVVDYIRFKTTEVMNTKSWKKLMKAHPDLAFDVMKLVLFK